MANALQTWDPVRELGHFRHDFDEMIERFAKPPWLQRFAAALNEPPIESFIDNDKLVVRAELPGVSKENIDLEVTSDGIEIRAKADRSREEKEKDYYFRERTYQAYERALSFPEEVKADLASATLKDGVLEVRIPKKQPTPESKPVKVPVE